MISRKSRLIAKLVWWAAGAPEVLLAAALVVIHAEDFPPQRLLWSDRWKRLARRLLADQGDLKRKLSQARSDAKMAQEDARRWKERWLKLSEEIQKEPIDR